MRKVNHQNQKGKKVSYEPGVTEGAEETRTDVREFEEKLSNGGVAKHTIKTTTRVKKLFKTSSSFSGKEIKTFLREDVVDKDILESIVKYPPGVNDLNRPDIKTDLFISSSEEALPNGAPVKKKILTTVVTLQQPSLPGQTGPTADKPNVTFKRIEGDVEAKVEEEDDEKNLDDGTAVKKKVVTTVYVLPVTEVKFTNGVPEVNMKEEILNANVKENILELGCGTVEPNAANCDTAIKVDSSETTSPEGVPTKREVTRMTVQPKKTTFKTHDVPDTSSQLRTTPSKGKDTVPGIADYSDKTQGAKDAVPKVTHQTVEGDIEHRPSVNETQQKLPDGGTIKCMTVTTKHVKPIREITLVDGIPTETKDREELVGTDIEENILMLPAGVIHPFASNCDTVISTENLQITLPDNTLANKTIIKTVVTLKDIPAASLIKPAASAVPDNSFIATPESTRIVDGDITARVEVKEDEQKLDSGRILKRKIITTTRSKPILKITTIGGIEKKSILREDLVDIEIVENILELPQGVTDLSHKGIKVETNVKNFHETDPSGIPVKRKIVKSVAQLTGKPEGFAEPDTKNKPSDVIRKIIEGDIEPKSETSEENKNFEDGSTEKKKKIVTRYVKPITEVTLTAASPPESQTREEIVSAKVKEVTVHLPCGVIKPNAVNCDVVIDTKDSEVVLPEGTHAPKKSVNMTVKIKDADQSSRRLIEGQIYPRATVDESEKTLPNGTVSKRKTVTTQYVQPIKEIIMVKNVDKGNEQL